ncbi:MAG: PIG-L family deacetylase [Lachnospiraceae bacterium]|nr:PIG-L family deacetylase [Lachnospiraceae bacterium]
MKFYKLSNNKMIKGAIAVMCFALTVLTPLTAMAAIRVPLDTSIEPDRNAGTDLFDTKCFYKNVLPLDISLSSGGNTDTLKDERYSTSLSLSEGTKITVKSETAMHGIYVIWDSHINEWTLTVNGKDYTYGQYGFLHEYIELPEMSNEVTITVPAPLKDAEKNLSATRVSDIIAFADDDLPVWVQTWEPTLDEADILLFSTHSDDEHIFFGGVLPIYQSEKNCRVQFAYFTQHWAGEKIREHEKLNGMWLAGAKYYPILGTFPDAYSTTYEGAAQTINEDAAKLYLTQCIRRTHPQVVMTQDVNGEYGHGQHIFMTANVIKAVEAAKDASYDEESVTKYGTWEVPKFYIHIYGDDRTTVDMRTPLESFGGKRAIDVARQAYLCHQSQQWCDFTVDDYGPYNCAAFGLYSSTVGDDVAKNDYMENLVSYDEQAEIKRQEEEAARLEEERIKAEQEEKERLEKEALEAASKKDEEVKPETKNDKKDKEDSLSGTEIFIIAAIVVVVLMIGGFAAYLIVSSNNKKKRRKHHKRHR